MKRVVEVHNRDSMSSSFPRERRSEELRGRFPFRSNGLLTPDG